MARGPSETLTGREAQIMDVVWRLGEATADQSAGPCRTARTTRPSAPCSGAGVQGLPDA